MIDIADTRPTLEQLWRQHADELLRYATVLVGPADASDVVAEAFLSAAPTAASVAVTNSRAYLYRAVAHRAHDLRRSRERRWRRDLQAVTPRLVAAADSTVDVRRAVAALSVSQRSVVYFAYWEDLPERAIAELLGLSAGTVRRHLSRAQSHLRKALA